jgi:phage tail tape-measure protein
MNGKIVCPKCGRSDKLYLRSTSQKIGTVVGGGAGGIAGYFGRSCGTYTGAAIGGSIGSIVPGLGTVTGAAVGGLVGALAGFFTGAAVGNRLGKQIDKHLVAKYKCGRCDGY